MKSLIHSTYLFGFISLFIFSACTGSVEQKEESPADAFTFRSYAMDTDAPLVKMAEVIDEISIVRLEETDESLLNYVGNVQKDGDNYYFSNSSTASIYYFSEVGDFLGRVARGGQGPEEYLRIKSVWMRGDTLRVYDQLNKEILSYNRQGEFISSKILPFKAMHVLETDEGYWLSIRDELAPDSVYYELVSLDKHLEVKDFYLPYEEPKNLITSSDISDFRWVDGRYTYKHLLKDSLFTIDEGKVDPKLHFDFGENYLWSDETAQVAGNERVQKIEQSGKVWIFYPYIGSEFIYLDYSTSFRKNVHTLIHRDTGEMVRIDRRNEAGETATYVANIWEDGRLLMSIGSLDLGGLLQDLDPSQYSFEGGATLDKIESSENPVLAWVKFKMPNR